jgi:hypothetical protein
MADAYKDFQREPSRAHQCMHESENDGARCRAMAMQNNYMCYAHRTDDVPTVIENDMFLIDNLDTHEAIQKVFLDVAARLACNHIDLKRAELLITLLRAASRNLRDAATARRQALREAAAEAKAVAAAAGAGAGAPGSTASSSTLGLNPADPLPNCHPERSSASAPNVVEGPAVAARTATNPRTSPKPPKRIYTDEEKNFLKWTTCSTHYAPVHRPRPESITDDDIIAAINAKRRICSLGPIETEPTWNRATLSANPAHPPPRPPSPSPSPPSRPPAHKKCTKSGPNASRKCTLGF